MKLNKYFLLAISVLFLSDLNAALSKIQDVKQTGRGNMGRVEIQVLNSEDYSLSNITKEYTANSVDIILEKTYIVPIRRVFK